MCRKPSQHGTLVGPTPQPPQHLPTHPTACRSAAVSGSVLRSVFLFSDQVRLLTSSSIARRFRRRPQSLNPVDELCRRAELLSGRLSPNKLGPPYHIRRPTRMRRLSHRPSPTHEVAGPSPTVSSSKYDPRMDSFQGRESGV